MGAFQSRDQLYEVQPEDWPWVWALRDPSNLDWKLDFSTGQTDELQSHAIQQQDLPVCIIEDKLYLGNAASVRNLNKLEKLGITAVLNMAGPVALPKKTIAAFRRQGLDYKRIDAEDEEDYPLLQKHWDEAYEFISTAIGDKSEPGGKDGKCVVHCVAGMNRSALVAARFYMVETQSSVLETVKHIRKQRGNVALQNEGFQEQLVAHARQMDLLGPSPGTPNSIVPHAPPSIATDVRMSPQKNQQAPKKENPLDRLFQ